MRLRALVVLAALPILVGRPAEAVPADEKVDGYLEWRHGDRLVVDGQGLRARAGTRFRGQGEATGPATIPLGYEIEAQGVRGPDGVIDVSEMEARPNGEALFEADIRQATDEAEARYRKAGRFFEPGAGGRVENVGLLLGSGPQVERARRITRALMPPYLRQAQVRVYVIQNPDWNAFAMGNFSIYVFSGLLDDLDDDEVGLVVGHELVHATHEHTRRQFKKQMWIQLAALGLTVATDQMDDEKARGLSRLVATFGATVWGHGYSRDLEDQADRVGLRYAYEAGFDVSRAPRLWERFAGKYGEQGRVANFFFADHSLASARARNLERELALNYPDAHPNADASAAPRRTAGPVSPASPTPRAAQGAAPAFGRPGSRPGLTRATPGGTRIDVGMTAEDVRRRLGEPSQELVYGRKSRWVYPNLSVIFDNGLVKEVRF